MNTLAKAWMRLCVLCCALLSGHAHAIGQPAYDTLYVFGDSLSDTGNDFIATRAAGLVPAVPPSLTPYATYYQGRFSNGPVAVEYLWRLLARNPAAAIVPSVTSPPLGSKGAVGFAFGGAATGVSNLTPGGFLVPGLLGQVNLFAQALGGGTARAGALYVVWAGSNDYIQSIPGTPPSPASVVANVTSAIRLLYGLGAREFLVPNLPDLGLSPLVRVPGLGAQFTQLARAHNLLLAQELAKLPSSLPGIRLMPVNVFAIGQVLVSSGVVITSPPALEYLAPGSGAADCLFRNTATCIDINLATPLPPFLFWDVLHPTTQVHGAIGLAMFAATLKLGR